jgi:hypothetical protein
MTLSKAMGVMCFAALFFVFNGVWLGEKPIDKTFRDRLPGVIP